MQPLSAGVTVMVALIAEAELLVAVNDGTWPFPLAARPMAGLEFVHVNVAPAGELVKVVAAILAPGHTLMAAGTLKIGTGLTVTTAAFEVTDPHELLTITS